LAGVRVTGISNSYPPGISLHSFLRQPENTMANTTSKKNLIIKLLKTGAGFDQSLPTPDMDLITIK
jgi:hypothetical protein